MGNQMEHAMEIWFMYGLRIVCSQKFRHQGWEYLLYVGLRRVSGLQQQRVRTRNPPFTPKP